MILFDTRYLDTKPRNYLDRFTAAGVPAEAQLLFAGDAVFWNADGSRSVCCEIKLPLDLCDCMERTGRLVQQLQNARGAGFDLYTVFAQGYLRTVDGDVGVLRRGGVFPVELAGSNHRVPFARLENFLTSLTLIEGVMVKRTFDDTETVASLLALYRWWQKDVEDHTSTRRFYTPVFMPAQHHSLVRRVAKELPGIGLEKSRLIAAKFPSLRSLTTATAKEWQEIDGIGKTLAQRIVQLIEKGEQQHG